MHSASRRQPRARAALSMAVAFGALALAGCSGETDVVRYRATAIVTVGGETLRSSSVRETAFTDTPNSMTGFELAIKDRGDAIVITPSGKPALYVLLSEANGAKVYPFIVQKCFGVRTGVGWAAQLKQIPIGRTCRLDVRDMTKIMPLVVAFADDNAPRSVHEATSATYKDATGVQARLIAMELERVASSTPLVSAIASRLPWLNDIPFDGYARVLEPYDHAKMLMKDTTLAMRLTDRDFRDQ